MIDADKKKSITFTINPYLNDILNRHLKENGLDNKSKFIEQLLEDKLKNNK